MRLTDLLAFSISSLWRRKLRTILTVLGVLIGTTSIVVMISLGLGANRSRIARMEKSGGLMRINLTSEAYNEEPGSSRSKKIPKIDAKAIKKIEAMPGVEAVVPVKHGNVMFDVMTLGKYIAIPTIMIADAGKIQKLGYQMLEGGQLSTTGDLEFIMGKSCRSLFLKQAGRMFEPVPEELIDWRKGPFVFEKTTVNTETQQASTKTFKTKCVGLIDAEGDDLDWSMVISDKAYKRLLKRFPTLFKDPKPAEYPQAFIKTVDMEHTLSLTKELKDMGYDARNAAEQIEAAREDSRSMQMLLGGIGSVAMLVAAISIANTMLMSIYERTREIGVMKVLGCRLKNILQLFLGEAAFIGFLGGVLGLAFSFGLSKLLNSYFLSSGDMSIMESYIPAWLGLLGLGFSVMVGVLAGLYPAIRATQLSALAAIRNET